MNDPLPADQISISHWSKEPVLSVRSVEPGHRDDYLSEYGKPKGFWISIDGKYDWADWCTSESYGDLSAKIRHRVVLEPRANILRLSDALDLDCFTERYKVEIPDRSWRAIAIDWPRVGREYQGIIIAPYVWNRRLCDHYSWYYPWDCASGCIWDGSAVALIEPLKEAA